MMKQKMMVMKLVMLLIIIGSAVFAVKGINMHKQVAVEEAAFHAMQTEYFSLDKATRDAAATGSELNAQLVQIKNYPSELLRLKLVGVGKILSGIYLLLFAILIALMVMPMRLGKIIAGRQKKME